MASKPLNLKVIFITGFITATSVLAAAFVWRPMDHVFNVYHIEEGAFKDHEDRITRNEAEIQRVIASASTNAKKLDRIEDKLDSLDEYLRGQSRPTP